MELGVEASEPRFCPGGPSIPSAGKGKIAKRKLSMDYTAPRRSTRLRKAVYEQQVDDEDVEHAKTSKRKTRADDPSYPATGSSLIGKEAGKNRATRGRRECWGRGVHQIGRKTQGGERAGLGGRRRV